MEKSKGFYRNRSKSLTFHQVKCVWNGKAQWIKGPLCTVGFPSLFFSVSAWWSAFVMCTERRDSCISLCESVRAFVRAVSQLFFLSGSHIGNHRIYLQIDFYKTILSCSPLLLLPTPFSQQSGHSCGMALWLLCRMSSGFCFREVQWDGGRNSDLVPGTLTSCLSTDLGPWKSHLALSSEVPLRPFWVF